LSIGEATHSIFALMIPEEANFRRGEGSGYPYLTVSKLVNPSTHQFSVDSAEQFVWEEWQ